MAEPWTPGPDLPIPGYWAGQYSLVALGNGKFLLAGGEDGRRKPLGRSFVYDGTWTETGPVVVPRRLCSVTKLRDGRVLVVGGLTGPPARPAAGTATAEIFDPGPRTWKGTGSLRQGRFAHTATLLPDDRVLVAGGIARRSADSHHAVRSVEIFTPSTGLWETTDAMTDPRFGQIAVPLLDDRILMVGGGVVIGPGSYGAQAMCELYDPRTGKWTPTGNLAVARKGHQATRLIDGRVMVSGGDGRGLVNWEYERYSQYATEVYEPGQGTWKQAGDMTSGRSHHRDVLLPSGKVLQVGGTDDGTFDTGYRTAAMFDPGTLEWSEAPAPAVGRFGFATAEIGGKVLIAGGLKRSGAAAFDPGADVATATSELLTI
ncbi:hypothetical protein GCM10009745_59680 [Kribbella yunnanensis]|uniref:Kelch-like protein 17 n=1 Tax=Kribbella yunnanensis TaxID=190194 RepID=A0ABP4UI22_9ACTN